MIATLTAIDSVTQYSTIVFPRMKRSVTDSSPSTAKQSNRTFLNPRSAAASQTFLPSSNASANDTRSRRSQQEIFSRFEPHIHNGLIRSVPSGYLATASTAMAQPVEPGSPTRAEPRSRQCRHTNVLGVSPRSFFELFCF
jgi:hypothetical protein